ncbi:MAG: hypothetical protein HQK50_17420 [Oligoflexia bacterium]|nr:hypothetical protein [Oligoflexia bacterium]
MNRHFTIAIKSMNKNRITFYATILLLISGILGCGTSKKEKREIAVDTAKVYLTNTACADAISVLEDAGRDQKDAKYLQTLASAYACRGGYSALTFYGVNLPKISVTQEQIFGSLTMFSTSGMIDPEDADYNDLLLAINILAYAGDVSAPTVAARAEVFSANEAGDINLQNLYMLFTILGKYLFYYGNSDPSTGTKGGGTAANGNPNGFSNGCFYDYNPSNATLKALIDVARASGTLGSCTSTATGSPKLQALPNANTVKRMCQGVVLLNIFIDILSNTTLPDDSAMDSVGEVKSLFNALCSDGIYSAYVGDLCNMRSQISCETNYATAPESDKLEAYFFIMFETLFN